LIDSGDAHPPWLGWWYGDAQESAAVISRDAEGIAEKSDQLAGTGAALQEL